MLTKEELPACPVASVIELIGNKWKLLILRRLQEGPVRFNELCRSVPGISQKVMRDNLRNLEEDGLVTRTVYPEVPPHVEYALSEIGGTLRPLFSAIAEWGSVYRGYLDRAEKDPACASGYLRLVKSGDIPVKSAFEHNL